MCIFRPLKHLNIVLGSTYILLAYLNLRVGLLIYFCLIFLFLLFDICICIVFIVNNDPTNHVLSTYKYIKC